MIFLAKEPKILVKIEPSRIDLSLAEGFFVDGPATDALLEWLKGYAKKKQLPLPLDLVPSDASFTAKVHQALIQIPFGEKTSYSTLAKLIGNPKGSRAVGNACGKNRYPLFIPCHRVLRGDGKMGGFSCGVEIKRRLLAFEEN